MYIACPETHTLTLAFRVHAEPVCVPTSYVHTESYGMHLHKLPGIAYFSFSKGGKSLCIHMHDKQLQTYVAYGAYTAVNKCLL